MRKVRNVFLVYALVLICFTITIAAQSRAATFDELFGSVKTNQPETQQTGTPITVGELVEADVDAVKWCFALNVQDLSVFSNDLQTATSNYDKQLALQCSDVFSALQMISHFCGPLELLVQPYLKSEGKAPLFRLAVHMKNDFNFRTIAEPLGGIIEIPQFSLNSPTGVELTPLGQCNKKFHALTGNLRFAKLKRNGAFFLLATNEQDSDIFERMASAKGNTEIKHTKDNVRLLCTKAPGDDFDGDRSVKFRAEAGLRFASDLKRPRVQLWTNINEVISSFPGDNMAALRATVDTLPSRGPSLFADSLKALISVSLAFWDETALRTLLNNDNTLVSNLNPLGIATDDVVAAMRGTITLGIAGHNVYEGVELPGAYLHISDLSEIAAAKIIKQITSLPQLAPSGFEPMIQSGWSVACSYVRKRS